MMAMTPGSDEQPAGHDAAERAVHQPADIGGELLRLGAGQQHAVVERMQEPLLGDPALLLDEDAVHHRDLAGRAAEAQRRNPHPRPERLAQGHAVRRSGSGLESAARVAASVIVRLLACRSASCGFPRSRRGTSDRRRRRAAIAASSCARSSRYMRE